MQLGLAPAPLDDGIIRTLKLRDELQRLFGGESLFFELRLLAHAGAYKYRKILLNVFETWLLCTAASFVQ